MRARDRRRIAINRKMWDESVPLHVASRDYDVPRFKKGWIPIRPLEIGLVGPVRGCSLLHLQCHFGMDTLSWARRGAQVTGVDFAPSAIAAARKLAREVDLDARFVESDVYAATRKLRGRFDVVYTGKGALCWLPDLTNWARTVAHFLKPGGRFFFLEDHPIAELFENERTTREFLLLNRYFAQEALRDESDGTYAVPEAKMRNALSFAWIHPISQVLTALIDSGLRIDSIAEYRYSYWRRFPFMRRGPDGWWHLTKGDGALPMMYSVLARKPGPSH